MIRKVLITATACFSLALLSGAAAAAESKTGTDADTYRMLQLFGDVFERVRSEYVEPVSDEELVESALNGMLTSLDPHSNYMNAKNFRDMQVQTKGEFGGLGIEVTMENGWVKVVSPIDDTPAARAGMQPNDYITHLNGEQVQGMTLNDAVDRMRGPVNTDIKLSVRREGKAPFDVTLTRAVIKIPSIKSKLVGNIGYVRISQFVESTDTDLRKALDQLKKDSGSTKMGGLVLDLRNNPGGLLDQAVAVSSDFLDKGQEVVSTRSRRAEDTQRFNAHGGDQTNGLPLVVLINDGSASASEIVAGALQDHHRATLLGTKSFGKGSVQTIIPLQGHGAIRLTTARYYTPSGRSIQAVGIEPDVKVSLGKLDPAGADRTPRSEAALRGALRNDTLPADQQNKPADDAAKDAPKDGVKPAADAKTSDAKPADGKPVDGKDAAKDQTNPACLPQPSPADTFKMGEVANDPQLARAIEILHGPAPAKAAGTKAQ